MHRIKIIIILCNYFVLYCIVYQVQNETKSVTIPTKPTPISFRSVNGWIIIQSRVDSTYPFGLLWNDYVIGFGNSTSSGNFWAGLDSMHLMTSQSDVTCRLRIEIQAADNFKYDLYIKVGLDLTRVLPHYLMRVVRCDNGSWRHT